MAFASLLSIGSFGRYGSLLPKYALLALEENSEPNIEF